MNIDAALKAIKATPKTVSENFMSIKFGYEKTLILPYSQGVALMATLAQAELLQDGYSQKPRIVSADQDAFTVNVVSRKLYEFYKIAGLLNLDKQEFDSMLEAAKNPVKEEETA